VKKRTFRSSFFVMFYYRIGILKMFFQTCMIFFNASCKYVLSFLRKDPTRIIVERVTKPMLGPMNFCRYDFCYKFKNYSVVLDTERTSFRQFKRYIMNSKLPSIPNRAIMSESIDVKKFNQFLGPLCDFYTFFEGALRPYSIDFFGTKNSNGPCVEYSVYDTRYIKQTFECMNSAYRNLWTKDCK
jgi:hypothetical protein